MTKNILNGLKTLHINRKSHGNLNLNNIFVSDDFSDFKIVDYANVRQYFEEFCLEQPNQAEKPMSFGAVFESYFKN
jgi:RIO-like serine/threonine protein kinase